MRRSISILLAAAMAVSGAATGVVPVQAAMPQAVPVAPTPAPISQFQDSTQSQLWHVGDRRDRGWRRGGALALGIFGLATGALLGSQLYGGYGGGYYGGGDGGGYYGGGDAYDSHDAACDQRFRSYDWRSNTYMGYDGQRHYC